MKQSRLMSLVEAVANVLVGFGVAVATQLMVFPWFGLPAHLSNALGIGAVFTVVSVLRSFVLRRVFERVRQRSQEGCIEGVRPSAGDGSHLSALQHSQRNP